MSRSRFYFSLTPSWAQSRTAKLVCCLLGAGLLGLGVAMAVASGWELRSGLLNAAQVAVYGGLLVAHGSGLTDRYMGQFVEISLGTVRWRLPEGGESLHPRYRSLRLAEVRHVEVGLLHVDFERMDGRHERLPLGALPYTVVQEIKRRFEGQASLAGATGGAVGTRSTAT